MLSLRVANIGPHSYVQQLVGNSPSAEYVTLRPLSPLTPNGDLVLDPALCVFLVGTPSMHTAYTVQALVDHSLMDSPAHVAKHSDDHTYFAVDKSDPNYLTYSHAPQIEELPYTPLPPLLTEDLSDIHYEALVLRMLGVPAGHLTQETKKQLLTILHDLNYTIVPPSRVGELLTAAGWGHRTYPEAEVESPATDERITPADILAGEAQPPREKYVIEDMTEAQKAAVTRNLRTRREAAPTKWPWRNMQLWQQVVIGPMDAPRAQRAVHSYSAASGKLFKTKRTENGELIVMRIEGSRIVKRLLD